MMYLHKSLRSLGLVLCLAPSLGACGMAEDLKDSVDGLRGLASTATDAASKRPAPTETRVTGNLAGVPFTLQSAVFVTLTDAPGPSQDATLVLLSDQPDLCATLTRRAIAKSSTVLAAAVTGVKPAVYSPLPLSALFGKLAMVGVGRLDAQCAPSLPNDATQITGGAIELNAIDTGLTGTAAGQIDIRIGSGGDAAKGTFMAEACPALGALHTSLIRLSGDPTAAANAAKEQLTCE